MLSAARRHLGPGPFAMLLAGLFFAAMGALVKEATQTLPLFEVTFFRAAVSALLIGWVMLRRNIPKRGENQKLLILRSLTGFTAMCLNFYAISKINLGDAALLNQTSPVFVMFLSWFFLSERFFRSLLFWTVVSFVGILFIIRPSGQVFNLAGAAGILGALFAAAAYVSIRRLHQTDSHWTMAFYFMATSATLSLLPMLLHWKTPSGKEWFFLIGSGMFGTLGQLLMTYAYKHDEASWVAPFSYAGVLFSFVLGMFFFGEIPDYLTLIGGAITVGAGIAILRAKKQIRLPYSAIIPPAPEK